VSLNFKKNNGLFGKRMALLVCCVLAIVCVSVYSVEGSGGALHGVQAGIRGAFSGLFGVGNAIDEAENSVADAAADVTADDATLTQLREQVAQLTELVTKTEEYRQEAQRLQELLNLNDSYEINGVSGHVIGRSTDAWSQTLLIDIGSSNGVEVGLTVVGSAGVIGQVISVESGSATVRLITDPSSGVAALIQSSREQGLVKGSLTGLVYLEDLDESANPQVGDVVLTSGLGGSYTKGLLIGTIVRVDGSATDATRTVIVSPNTDISTVEEVTVVFSARDDD
jgi:rod shape-determining protein MreC